MPRRVLTAAAAAAALLLGVAHGEQVDGASDKLQWQGRTLVNDGAPWRSFSWPGVRFSFTVTRATYAYMSVQSNNTLTRAKVFVDGSEAAWLWVGDSVTGGPYMLFQGLSPNDPHTVTVYNTAEPAFQNSNNFYQKPTLISVTTDGAFLPAPAPLPRALELIGDSLTAGFGANGVGPCPGTILTEDNSVTWGNLLCANFSANCSIIAWSGIGVYENSNGFGSPRMPELYTRTLGANPEAQWDFSSFTPDLVIINLGTNDFGHSHDNGTAWEDAFVDTYVRFVFNITQLYYKQPTLPVLVAVGPGQRAPNVLACLGRVISGVNAAGGAASLLDVQTEPMEGCDGHPGRAGHQAMFQAAQPQVAKVMGW